MSAAITQPIAAARDHTVSFKVATLKNPRDGEPKVVTYTIDQLVQRVAKAPVSQTPFAAYHRQKSELKRYAAEARSAHDAGDIATAKKLKAEAKRYKDALDGTKFGPAIMPFIFNDDVTHTFSDGGRKHRANDRISHFSLVMLDIESGTSKDEIHAAMSEYEYLLWPTISHTEEDPRYRVVLFPAQPLTVPDAQALIHRIDAHLPARNDINKKTQNIDPVSDEIGRLMFLPKWLIGHPEKYSSVHHRGRLLSPDSFPVSPDVQTAIDARRKAADEHRERQKNETITRLKSITAPTHNGNALITVKETDWLNPDYYFETEDGYIQLKDVTKKVGGVRCPFHADSIGSEFIAPNQKSGRPQLVCAKCGVFKMSPHNHDLLTPDMDSSEFAALVQKAKSGKATSSATVTKKPGRLVEQTVEPDLYPFNSRYLPDIQALLPEQGTLFVRSPKGTGKTKTLYSVVQQARRLKRPVMVLTHRRSLAKNLSERLDLHNYQDLEGGSTLSDYTVVCVNSLTSRLDETAAQYDIVIIDESEQVLRNLLSDTLKKDLSDIFSKILLLLTNARQVICLDADLSGDMTIELIAHMRDPKGEKARDRHVGIINDYKIGAGKIIRSLPNKYQLLAEIAEAAEAGKKIFIASSTARAATVIGEMLKAQGKNVLVITAETSSEYKVRYFQAFPNDTLAPSEDKPRRTLSQDNVLVFDGESARDGDPEPQVSVEEDETFGKYDAVIASPSLQTGFSIDVPYFDKVFGWFQSVDGITYQDYDQALSRVRHCDDVTVWVQGVSLPTKIEPPEAFIQEARIRELKSLKTLPDQPRTLNEAQQLWVRIEGLIRYLTALWCYQRDVKFKSMKKDLGFAIEEIHKDEDLESLGRELWQLFKDAGPVYAEQVFKADVLSEDDFLTISRKQHKTNEDHFALRRYRIANHVTEELTLPLVKQAIEEDMLRIVSRVRAIVLEEDVTRAASDVKSRENHHTAFTKASHRTVEHELLVKHLCKAVDVDLKQLYHRISSGEDIEVPTQMLDKIVDAYVERQVDFAHFFDLRIASIKSAVEIAKKKAEVEGVAWTPDDEAAAVEKAKQNRRKRVWDGTLGTLGLPLKKKKRGPRGNQIATYFIDNDAVDLTMKAILQEDDRQESVLAALGKARKRRHELNGS